MWVRRVCIKCDGHVWEWNNIVADDLFARIYDRFVRPGPGGSQMSCDTEIRCVMETLRLPVNFLTIRLRDEHPECMDSISTQNLTPRRWQGRFSRSGRRREYFARWTLFLFLTITRVHINTGQGAVEDPPTYRHSPSPPDSVRRYVESLLPFGLIIHPGLAGIRSRIFA